MGDDEVLEEIDLFWGLESLDQQHKQLVGSRVTLSCTLVDPIAWLLVVLQGCDARRRLRIWDTG